MWHLGLSSFLPAAKGPGETNPVGEAAATAAAALLLAMLQSSQCMVLLPMFHRAGFRLPLQRAGRAMMSLPPHLLNGSIGDDVRHLSCLPIASIEIR